MLADRPPLQRSGPQKILGQLNRHPHQHSLALTTPLRPASHTPLIFQLPHTDDPVSTSGRRHVGAPRFLPLSRVIACAWADPCRVDSCEGEWR
jgi:hypothetical protein